MYHPPPPQDGMYHPADALQDYAAPPPIPHASGAAEPDWTCPNCGNVNFGFRVTCNMRKCGAPKPGTAPTPPPRPRPAPSYPPAPAPYAPPPAYGNYGGPPPPHIAGGPPSYPPPSAIPPQYAPYPPAPGYDINPAPSYGGYDMPLPAPVSYGGGYGGGRPPPMADSLGKRKGGAGGGGEGDWACPSCGNTNFAFRKVCNMRRCGAPRPAHLDYLDHEPVVSRKFAKTDDGQPDGSWVCNACGNVNYPFRTKCNRRNCGAPKGSEPPLLQPPPPQLQQPPHVRAQEQAQAQAQSQGGGHVQVQPQAQAQPAPDRSVQPAPSASTNGGPVYPPADGASDAAGYAPPPYVGPGEVSELPVQSEAASQ
eukprot:jgi/Chlat1/2957/Chrsp2S04692